MMYEECRAFGHAFGPGLGGVGRSCARCGTRRVGGRYEYPDDYWAVPALDYELVSPERAAEIRAEIDATIMKKG